MKGIARTLFVSALLLGAVSASPAAADPPASPVKPVQLALGDSWAAGAGAPAGEGYVPQLYEVLKEDFNCSGAGPVQAKSGCPQLQLVNVAIGGATTPSMIEVQVSGGDPAAGIAQRQLQPPR